MPDQSRPEDRIRAMLKNTRVQQAYIPEEYLNQIPPDTVSKYQAMQGMMSGTRPIRPKQFSPQNAKPIPKNRKPIKADAPTNSTRRY